MPSLIQNVAEVRGVSFSVMGNAPPQARPCYSTFFLACKGSAVVQDEQVKTVSWNHRGSILETGTRGTDSMACSFHPDEKSCNPCMHRHPEGGLILNAEDLLRDIGKPPGFMEEAYPLHGLPAGNLDEIHSPGSISLKREDMVQFLSLREILYQCK